MKLGKEVNKRHPNWKGRNKIISVHRQHSLLCTKAQRLRTHTHTHTDTHTQRHTHTHTHLLQQINKLSKVAGSRINTQKLFLYINNYNPKKEIKKTISFTIGPKRIKYLGRGKKINLHTGNYKTLLKEIKHNKQKDILFSWIRRLNIIKNGHTTQSDPLIQFNTLFFFRELIPTQHDGIHLLNFSVYCLQITRHARHRAGIFFFLSCLSLDLQSLEECVVHR